MSWVTLWIHGGERGWGWNHVANGFTLQISRANRHGRFFSPQRRQVNEHLGDLEYEYSSLICNRSSTNCCQPAIASQGSVAVHQHQIPCHSKPVLSAFADLLLNSSCLRITNTMPWSLALAGRDFELRLVWPKQDSILLVYQNCFLREVIP